MEELSEMQNDVDVNILITVYNQRMSNLINQNVLLEAKIQSLIKDFSEEKNKLLMVNLELQKKNDELIRSKKSSLKLENKELNKESKEENYEDSEINP